MKKLNKLLVPTLAVSALAVVPTIGMTSCTPKQDTKIVGYTVENHMIYGLNASNEKIKLTNDQIDELAGGFLVTNADGTYFYVDKNGKVEGSSETYPTSVKGFIERATEKQVWDYEITLIKGEYNLDSVDAKSTYFFVNGIIDYETGMPLATLNCIPVHEDSEDPADFLNKNIDLGKLGKLAVDSVIVKGSHYGKNGSKWKVCGAAEFSFSNCYMFEKNIFHGEKDLFYNCLFDSSSIKLYESSDSEVGTEYKTDYAIGLYNVQQAYFYGCSFISRGKAIKINNPDNPIPGCKYAFNGCHFEISAEGIPNEEDSDPDNWGDQNKCAIDICNKNFSAANKLQVFYYDITGDIQNFNDETPKKDMHWGMIGSQTASQWFPDYAEVKEGLPE